MVVGAKLCVGTNVGKEVTPNVGLGVVGELEGLAVYDGNKLGFAEGLKLVVGELEGTELTEGAWLGLRFESYGKSNILASSLSNFPPCTIICPYEVTL